MLEVHEQPRPPLGKLIRICRLSLAHRLLRSLITVGIIAVAIAFLASILFEGFLGRATRNAVAREAEEVGAYSRFLAEVRPFGTEEEMMRAIAGVEEGGAAFENLRAWGGLGEAEARRLVESCRRLCGLFDAFGRLPMGRRVLLAGDREGVRLMDWLSEPGNSALFLERLDAMRSVRLPIPRPQLELEIAGWPWTRERLSGVREGRARTARAIAEAFAPEGVVEALRGAVGGDRAGEFFDGLAGLGLVVDASARERIEAGARFEARLEEAFRALRRPEVRQAWRVEFQEDFSPAGALASCANSPGRVRWIARRLAQSGEQTFDETGFLETAVEFRDRRALFETQEQFLRRFGASSRLDARTVWLIAVSLLVCVVGIANAMLMSVLERFKEIATMKCLGARNETIGFLFMTESLAMGALGGLAGTALAFLFRVLPALAAHGRWLAGEFPAGEVLLTVAISFAGSFLLAGIAAIYPAHVASRMAPLEAMRVE